LSLQIKVIYVTNPEKTTTLITQLTRLDEMSYKQTNIYDDDAQGFVIKKIKLIIGQFEVYNINF
jgi:hypothetical protein